MRIVKPIYINFQKPHKDQILTEICSIDIHPSGKKFATSGGGDKYGIITIWNMDPVRYKEKEVDDSCPKILYTDYTHLKCVNCVRWSPNGKYLASGSVDTVVVIWVQKKLNDLEHADKKFHESYRSAFQLRGHSSDIMDLAWSPHGVYLCSGSIDNRIIVWNAEKFPEKAAVLSGHNGFVKGVCWDPVGRYLASQSEDYTLRIWRTSDWKQESKLSDEIDKNSCCSFRRLTWSPDGSNVVATGTSNSGAPTCQLYNRDNWSKGVDMVGHKQHVICARYFPTLLKTKDTNQEFLLLALGSKDRSLSVWTTLRRRPLVVVSDLFTYSIVDLSWHVENFELMACSLDGSIVYLQFTVDELGVPLNADEMAKHFEKTYGSGFLSDNMAVAAGNPHAFILPESAAVLELQRRQHQLVLDRKSSSLASLTNEKRTGPNEQITCRTHTGKRRITPKFLNSLDDEDIEPEPVPVSAKRVCQSQEVTEPLQNIQEPAITPTKPIVKESDDVMISNTFKVSYKFKSVLEEKFVKPDSPVVSTGSTSGSGSSDDKRDVKLSLKTTQKRDDKSGSDTSLPRSVSSSESKSPKKEDKLTDSVVSFGSSGSNATHNLSISSVPQTPPGSSGSSGASSVKPASSNNSQEIKSPKKDELPSNLASLSMNISNSSSSGSIGKPKATKDQQSDSTTSSGSEIKSNSRRSILYKDIAEKVSADFVKPLDISTAISINMSENDNSPRKHLRDNKTLAEKRLQLNQPVIKENFSLLCLLPGERDHFVVKIINENSSVVLKSVSNSSDTKLYKLCVNKNEHKLWEIIQSKQISVLAHFKDRLYVGDVCGYLHAFYLKGGRIMAPLVLDGGLTNLVCDGKFLIAVTTRATLFIWSIAPFAVFVKESFLHLLTDDGDKSVVKNIQISPEGNISLAFESGSSFLFSKMLGIWQEVYNNSNKFEFWSVSKLTSKSLLSKPLALMQLADPIIDDSSKGLSAASKTELILDRLEIQVKLAESLNSPDEYKYWLLLWVRHLIEADKETRVRDVCQYFLGPVNTSTRSSWDPFISRNSKRDLLREILPLFALNLRMQGLYTELHEQLDMLK